MATVAKETNSGRYINEKKDDSVQLENTSAVTHIKPSKGGKISKAHLSNSEPTVYTPDNTNIQSRSAAELKKELERKVSAVSQNNTESKTKKNEKSDTVFETTPDKVDSKKYFTYNKAKIENKHLKRVYKIEKKYKITAENTDDFSLARKIRILNQTVIVPIKKGNAAGITAIPTKLYLKKLLEKSSFGRAAIRSKEVNDRVLSAAENTADTSQAMTATTEKAAKVALDESFETVNRYIKREIQHNKYIKDTNRKAEIAENKINKENKYLKSSLDKLSEKERAVNAGETSAKLQKKIENFNEKGNSKKKQQKIDNKNKNLEKKITKQRSASQVIKEGVKKKSKAKILSMIAASGMSSIIPILLLVVIMAIIICFVTYPFFYLSVEEEVIDEDGNTVTENKIEDSEIPLTVAHYHGIMNGVVDKINAEIDAIFAGGDEYNNTGVINPAKKAQYDKDYQNYLDNLLYDDTISEPEKDYWYTEDELSNMGMERGPIFEGYRWSPDTDAKKVPYGKLYDEMLCTIAAYNSKLMNQAGNTDIIFMNDETVEAAYVGANFWELSNWKESVGCKSGGNCCSKKVPVTVYNDKGEAVGIKYESQTYCPGHFVIMIKLKLNFDLDEVWDTYGFDDQDKKNYDEIYKQLLKDK